MKNDTAGTRHFCKRQDEHQHHDETIRICCYETCENYKEDQIDWKCNRKIPRPYGATR